MRSCRGPSGWSARRGSRSPAIPTTPGPKPHVVSLHRSIGPRAFGGRANSVCPRFLAPEPQNSTLRGRPSRRTPVASRLPHVPRRSPVHRPASLGPWGCLQCTRCPISWHPLPIPGFAANGRVSPQTKTPPCLRLQAPVRKWHGAGWISQIRSSQPAPRARPLARQRSVLQTAFAPRRSWSGPRRTACFVFPWPDQRYPAVKWKSWAFSDGGSLKRSFLNSCKRVYCLGYSHKSVRDNLGDMCP